MTVLPGLGLPVVSRAEMEPARTRTAADSSISPGGWRGRLSVQYRRDGERTISHDLHEGPLRLLQRLYPEGPGVCHHVLVHPPGGIVGGDQLEIDLTLAPGSHAVLTTPGATRFYRSAGLPASQVLTARVQDGGRLEWLPLENIAYPGCQAENRVTFALEGSAEMIGWDLLALGLPAAGAAFDRGRMLQQVEWPGRWLERGLIDGTDTRLLDSPLGLAGRRALATRWFASAQPIDAARREALVDLARGQVLAPGAGVQAGVTCPHDRLVILRGLADRVEPLMGLLKSVRASWRRQAWGLDDCAPRVWRT